jgi:inner membrane protein
MASGIGRLSQPSPTLPAMMKRSHAVIGAAAGVAVAHATGASMVAGGIVAGLAGLLPDIDHPHAAVGRLLPRWWHRLTPGHRGPTHSLAWCLAVAVLAYVGNSAVNGQPAGPLLALAVLAGSLSHVLADGLTVAGVPLWWPFRRRRAVFLGVLAFRTRSWAEILVVLGVVAAVGWWVAG